MHDIVCIRVIARKNNLRTLCFVTSVHFEIVSHRRANNLSRQVITLRALYCSAGHLLSRRSYHLVAICPPNDSLQGSRQ